jgi:pimeloyl-ACP methyl ester carboxylesterase
MKEDLADLKKAADMADIDAPIVLPEEHHVVLRGMRFHYLDWGTAGLPPIVFLHGGGLTAHTWDLVCLGLRSNYRCLALDQRGHGDSEWSPVLEYSISAQAGDVQAFVDHLALERFVLVGMSMGGINSIRYAAENTERLSALVLVDVGPDVKLAGARRIQEFTIESAELDSVDEFVERAMKFNPRRDAQLLRRSLLHNLRQMPNGKWTWKYDRRHRSTIDVMRMTESFQNLWAEVPRITCPTLVVRGGESDVFGADDADKLVEALPNARSVCIEGASHSVQGDQPKELTGELSNFLTEQGIGE